MYSKEQKDIAALRIYHQTESVTETIRIFESYRVQTQTWIGHLYSPRKCLHPPLITYMELAIAVFTSSSFFAPKHLETITPMPEESPIHNEKNKKLIMPTEPTAP